MGRSERARGSQERPQPGNALGAQTDREDAPLHRGRPGRCERGAAGGRGSGAGDGDGPGAGAGRRAAARRAARAQRSRAAAGWWCWSAGARVSSPLALGAEATPGGFLPGAGCGRRASPPPGGVADAPRPPLPTCAAGPRPRPALRGPSNTAGRGPGPRAPAGAVRSAPRRGGRESLAPARKDLCGLRVGNRLEKKSFGWTVTCELLPFAYPWKRTVPTKLWLETTERMLRG